MNVFKRLRLKLTAQAHTYTANAVSMDHIETQSTAENRKKCLLNDAIITKLPIMMSVSANFYVCVFVHFDSPFYDTVSFSWGYFNALFR